MDEQMPQLAVVLDGDQRGADPANRAGHRVGAENAVTSCDLHILVYQAAESISSQRPDCSCGRWGSGACGRLLMQRPVRAMSVGVLDVVLQHDRSGGVWGARSQDWAADQR